MVGFYYCLMLLYQYPTANIKYVINIDDPTANLILAHAAIVAVIFIYCNWYLQNGKWIMLIFYKLINFDLIIQLNEKKIFKNSLFIAGLLKNHFYTILHCKLI